MAGEPAPGARLRWSHHPRGGGDPVVREGVVWSLGPPPEGGGVLVWVTPANPRPADLYRLVAVARSGGAGWHSSDDPGTVTGAAAVVARREALAVRAARARQRHARRAPTG